MAELSTTHDSMCLFFALSFPTPSFLAGSSLRRASLVALEHGGADLVCVCSVKVGDLPLHLTALIQCAAMVEGCEICSYFTIMASRTPMKVVVARVWLACCISERQLTTPSGSC